VPEIGGVKEVELLGAERADRLRTLKNGFTRSLELHFVVVPSPFSHCPNSLRASFRAVGALESDE
jgi:hypothetical protein